MCGWSDGATPTPVSWTQSRNRSSAGSAPIVLPAAGSASEILVVAPWIEDARPLQHNSSTVAMLPDFNGDGLADALFATPGADTGGPASGGAFVI